jgi:hypothetical protein
VGRRITTRNDVDRTLNPFVPFLPAEPDRPSEKRTRIDESSIGMDSLSLIQERGRLLFGYSSLVGFSAISPHAGTSSSHVLTWTHLVPGSSAATS